MAFRRSDPEEEDSAGFLYSQMLQGFVGNHGFQMLLEIRLAGGIAVNTGSEFRQNVAYLIEVFRRVVGFVNHQIILCLPGKTVQRITAVINGLQNRGSFYKRIQVPEAENGEVCLVQNAKARKDF